MHPLGLTPPPDHRPPHRGCHHPVTGRHLDGWYYVCSPWLSSMSQCCDSSLAVHNITPDSIRKNASSVNPGPTGGCEVSAYYQGPVPASLSGRDALAAITETIRLLPGRRLHRALAPAQERLMRRGIVGTIAAHLTEWFHEALQ